MSDTPNITDSWASIEKEVRATDAKPYVLALPDSKRITFPNPGDMNWVEGEELVRFAMTAGNVDFFRKYLSADDFKAFSDLRPTLSQVLELSKRIGKHYEVIFGTVGESSASQA